MTIDRSIEEPCEVTSLTHGFEAERRGRPLRLGNRRGLSPDVRVFRCPACVADPGGPGTDATTVGPVKVPSDTTSV
jgi:hypothetical protein